ASNRPAERAIGPQQPFGTFHHHLKDVVPRAGDLLDHSTGLALDTVRIEARRKNQVGYQIEAFGKITLFVGAAPVEDHLLARLGADVASQPIDRGPDRPIVATRRARR